MQKKTYVVVKKREPDEDGRSTILVPIKEYEKELEKKKQKMAAGICMSIVAINMIAIFVIMFKIFCAIISPSNMVAAVICTFLIEVVVVSAAYGLPELLKAIRRFIEK